MLFIIYVIIPRRQPEFEMEVPFLSEIFGHRVLSTDDDFNNGTKTNDLINTFYINVVIFIILIAIFEVNRHFKSIYFPRLQSRFKASRQSICCCSSL